VQPQVPFTHRHVLQPSPAGFISPSVHTVHSAIVQLHVRSGVQLQLLQPSLAGFVSPGSHSTGQ
jgi:hypothetical protein